MLNYDEEASRAVFESGNAVFHRNWPYVWGTSHKEGSAIVDKVGVMPLPVGKEGQKSSGCLGPMYYGVSKYSAKPEVAADFVNFITGPDMQKKRALQARSQPVDPGISTVIRTCWRRSPSSRTTSRPLPIAPCVRPATLAPVTTACRRPSTARFTTCCPVAAISIEGLASLAERLEKLKESR